MLFGVVQLSTVTFNMHRTLSIIGIVLVAILLRLHLAIGVNSYTDERWKQFKQKYNKIYSDALDQNRREQWESNLEYIAQHNLEAEQGIHTYTLGENQFADLNADEFRQLLMYRSGKSKSKSRVKRQGYYVYCADPAVIPSLPTYVNWTAAGWVTPVENQGDCGACWAFSSCGALEGLYYNETGTLVVLSEQNLIDCSVPYGNYGCEGGNPQNAFRYVKANGIDTSADYPYTEMDYNAKLNDTAYGQCEYNASLRVDLMITGYQDVDSGNEDALQQAVALTGPVAILIDASPRSFHHYRGGIYNNLDCSPNTLDHSVLVVGYGTNNNADYWLLKNSWGTSWGMDGYMMLARNADNMCGVASDASFPIDYIPPAATMSSCPSTTTTTSSTTTPPTTTSTTTTSRSTATTSKSTTTTPYIHILSSHQMFPFVVLVAVVSYLNFNV